MSVVIYASRVSGGSQMAFHFPQQDVAPTSLKQRIRTRRSSGSLVAAGRLINVTQSGHVTLPHQSAVPRTVRYTKDETAQECAAAGDVIGVKVDDR